MFQNNWHQKRGFFLKINEINKFFFQILSTFPLWRHPVASPVPTNSLPNYRFAAIESQRQVKPFHVYITTDITIHTSYNNYFLYSTTDILTIKVDLRSFFRNDEMSEIKLSSQFVESNFSVQERNYKWKKNAFIVV